MNEPSYISSDFLAEFLFLSALYLVPIGILYMLIKFTSKIDPNPYTLSSFLLICIPGLVYSFLESTSSRQGLNFIIAVLILFIAALVSTLFIRRVNLTAYVIGICILALTLWWTIPKAMMKLF